jgi:lipopolysaccharide/colanic/teichoic acid biosynthesis glycosyltransferase
MHRVEARGAVSEPRSQLAVSALTAGTALGQAVANRVLGAVLLVPAAPILLAVAVALKIASPRAPVFYRQERVGLNRRQGARSLPDRDRRRGRGEGKPFGIWKFRTMIPDAEAGTGPVWATDDDPRITRIGRVLRKTRLDELPQLFNVVRGEMFVVGPRPERPHFVSELAERVPDYRRRLKVPPGITGLAQVEREYDADLDDVRTKLRYDLFYIENRRPSMDLKILLKTLAIVLLRRGAR